MTTLFYLDIRVAREVAVTHANQGLVKATQRLRELSGHHADAPLRIGLMAYKQMVTALIRGEGKVDFVTGTVTLRIPAE